MANEKKARPGAEALTDKEEAYGLVTSNRACEILGMTKGAFIALVYEHAEELKAFRMGGIILMEMQALLIFRDKRAAKLREQNQRREARSMENEEAKKKRELREKLSTLSPEQVEALLGQLGA